LGGPPRKGTVFFSQRVTAVATRGSSDLEATTIVSRDDLGFCRLPIRGVWWDTFSFGSLRLTQKPMCRFRRALLRRRPSSRSTDDDVQIPKDFNLLELKGGALQMVCFAKHAAYLHFDNDLLITIEGDFQHLGKHVACNERQSLPVTTSGLLTLIGYHVAEIQEGPDCTLTLIFSNSESLIVYGDNGPFEAYHIKFRGREVTI
jgi:hypothetical protein